MKRNIFLWVFSLALIALALAIFLPGGRAPDRDPKLPWDIKLDHQGGSEIFGLSLGKSTLNDAKSIFQNDGKVSLFITKNGKPALEAYFERIFLSGLRADFVLVLEAEDQQLQAFYDRGSRISRTTDITRKVDLAGDDKLSVGSFPIKLINYIPAADLDKDLILKRFGEPDQRIEELATGVSHWIYPETGLSIGVNPDGKELLQYILPSKIDILTEAIRQQNQDQTTP